MKPITADFAAQVADALSEMIDLSDAWASAGPEGYTREEQKRRNAAERILARLNRHIAPLKRAA